MRTLFIWSIAFFIGCGSSEKEQADTPRQEIYNAAILKLKQELKDPSKAKIPNLTNSNDSVRIFQKNDTAVVAMPCNEQSVRGAWLRGYIGVLLYRDSVGWSNQYAVMVEIEDKDYNNFDKAAEFLIDAFNGGSDPKERPY